MLGLFVLASSASSSLLLLLLLLLVLLLPASGSELMTCKMVKKTSNLGLLGGGPASSWCPLCKEAVELLFV